MKDVYSHRFLEILFDEMERKKVTMVKLSKISGVSLSGIKNWRNRAAPDLVNLEACLNSVGLKMAIVPIDE